METITITSAQTGAIVHITLDQIEGSFEDATRVAQELVDTNTYEFDEAGDVYTTQFLRALLAERQSELFGVGSRSHEQDEVSDGSHSALSLDIAGVTCLWTRGIHDSCESDLCIRPMGTTIEQWVRSWDEGSRDWAEQFGFGRYGASESVDEDYDGEVSILVEPCFSHDISANSKPYMLTDGDGDVIVFSHYAKALKHINGLNMGVYHLKHGEMGRPVYRIVPAA